MSSAKEEERGRAFFYRRNLLWSLILQVSNICMTLLVPRIMIETYGSEQNGLVTSVTQIVTMFLVVEAGLSNAAMVALYKPLVARAHSAVRGLMGAIDRLYRPVAAAFGLLVVLLALLYPRFVDVASLPNLEVSLLILVLGLNGLADFLFYAKYRVLLNASQRSYLVSQASVAYVLLNGLIIALAAWGGLTLLEGRWIAVFAIVSKILLLRYSGRRIIDLDGEVDKQNISSIPNRGDVLFQQILGSVQVGAPAILATLFTSLNDVSVLSMYLIVATGLISVVSIVSSAATAGFGHLYANGSLSPLRRAYSDLEFVFTHGVGVVFGVCFFLISPFVDIYVNSLDDVDYYDPLLGVLVCINAWLYVIKAPGGMMIISSGHFKETRYRVLTQGLILVLGGIALAPLYGLYGIMIASIASNLYRVIDLAFYVPIRILRMNPWRTLARNAQSLGLLILIGSLGFYLVSLPLNWMQFVGWGVVGVFVGALLAVLMSTVLERQALSFIWKRIKRS